MCLVVGQGLFIAQLLSRTIETLQTGIRSLAKIILFCCHLPG